MSGSRRGGATKMTKLCVCCKSATSCGLAAVVCPEYENTCVFCVFGSAVVCPDFWQRKQVKQLNNFFNFLITYLHFLSYSLLITSWDLERPLFLVVLKTTIFLSFQKKYGRFILQSFYT